jgi:hypothetical protein
MSVIDTVMNLGNDKTTIKLLSASSTVIDKVSYSPSKGGDGDGNSLQDIGGTWRASLPTPGMTNSYVPKPKVAKPEKTSSAKKSKAKISKKVAAAPKPEILDGTSTVSTDLARNESLQNAEVASVAVPLEGKGNTLMPWFYGALALGVAGAGAVMVARKKKEGEWDIEEIA